MKELMNTFLLVCDPYDVDQKAPQVASKVKGRRRSRYKRGTLNGARSTFVRHRRVNWFFDSLIIPCGT